MNVRLLITKYKSIGVITSSLLIGAIVTFIALPFLTRLYPVRDFGEYGVALAVVSVLSTVANLRLDQALLVANDADKKSLVFEGSFFSFVFCAFSAAVLFFIFNLDVVFAICTGVLSNSLIQSVYNYKFSQENEFFCANLNILRSTIIVVTQLSFPMIMEIKLVNSYNISSLIMIAAMLSYILKNGLYRVNWLSFKKYKDFIFSNTPHALLNSFSHNLPYYIVAHFVGVHAVGFYSIVERTLRVPITLMSQTIRQFYIRKFKQEQNTYTALRSSIFLSIISLPFFLIFLVLPESLYLSVFGEEWQGISLYFKILALGYWAVFCNPPISAYIIAKRKSNVLFGLQIVELLIKFLLFVLLYFFVSDKVYLLFAIPISLVFYNFSIMIFVWSTRE
ncbi:lipopolysaccharide biosynthesis protein [Acinetobacter pittii]|uniref:lipopolysaccharide biosynthesis protein n=1 Tax=Acinetobacter pittii TaxID=48296 RepID=UPI00300B07A8